MNKIKIWNYDNLEIRTIEKDGEPWWVLSDVCKVLELSNPSKVAQRLDEDERSNFELGRQGTAIIINESGLYSVILRSDKPEAKPFRKWVTSEVLPSIRKTGSYQIAPNHETMKESARVGEVASLIKVVRSVMKDQKSSPEKIAFTTKTICNQCGINLPENFVEENPFNGQLLLIGFGA